MAASWLTLPMGGLLTALFTFSGAALLADPEGPRPAAIECFGFRGGSGFAAYVDLRIQNPGARASDVLVELLAGNPGEPFRDRTVLPAGGSLQRALPLRDVGLALRVTSSGGPLWVVGEIVYDDGMDGEHHTELHCSRSFGEQGIGEDAAAG